jgi:hypothetical protein
MATSDVCSSKTAADARTVDDHDLRALWRR